MQQTNRRMVCCRKTEESKNRAERGSRPGMSASSPSKSRRLLSLEPVAAKSATRMLQERRVLITLFCHLMRRFAANENRPAPQAPNGVVVLLGKSSSSAPLWLVPLCSLFPETNLVKTPWRRTDTWVERNAERGQLPGPGNGQRETRNAPNFPRERDSIGRKGTDPRILDTTD